MYIYIYFIIYILYHIYIYIYILSYIYISYSGWFKDISAGSPDVTVPRFNRRLRGVPMFVQGRAPPVKWQSNQQQKNDNIILILYIYNIINIYIYIYLYIYM